MDPETTPATPDPTHAESNHIEPAAEMLDQADAGVMAAFESALAGGESAAAAEVNEPDATAAKEPSATTEAAAEPATDEAAKPDAATEAQPPAAAEEGKRPSDEFGELPKDAKAETRDRFETLKSKYDDVHRERDTLLAERDEYKGQAERWVETVSSTGASPEQFGQSLQYLQAVNSGTPEGLQAAYDLLSKELEALGKIIGRPAGAYDPLDDHPDLKQRVDDNFIERTDALEIAQARAARNMPRPAAAGAQPAMSPEAQAGLQRVQAVGAELRAADPHFEAKTKMLQPTIERVIAKMPPDAWEGAIRDLYANAPAPVVAAPAPPAAASAAPAVTTTLRPTSAPSASGLTRQPGSALEAMDAALANLR